GERKGGVQEWWPGFPGYMIRPRHHPGKDPPPLFRCPVLAGAKRHAAIFSVFIAPPPVSRSSERICSSSRKSSPAQITSSVVNTTSPAPSAARVRRRELRRRPSTRRQRG